MNFKELRQNRVQISKIRCRADYILFNFLYFILNKKTNIFEETIQ